MKRERIVQMMIWELERGYNILNQTINEISQEEAQWKPSLNTRTLDTIRQWNAKGNDWVSAQNLDPVSTIEYKVVHLAQCKVMYDEYAFRKGTLKWSDMETLEWPKCKKYLKRSHGSLVESLQSLTDDQLENLVLTNWRDRWPIKKIITSMIHHDAYHFGQICTVRSLYKIRESSY
ncbi:MAG: DinB family protein [Candidatus Hodarchaeales archaeon]|jgi:uncharacterized damage-inducible protein DinB